MTFAPILIPTETLAVPVTLVLPLDIVPLVNNAVELTDELTVLLPTLIVLVLILTLAPALNPAEALAEPTTVKLPVVVLLDWKSAILNVALAVSI